MNAKNRPMSSEQEDDVGLPPPKAGDRFRCAQCGMELQVTSDCRCKEGEHVHFHCCDQEMVQA